MKLSTSQKIQIVVIALAIFTTTLLHFLTPTHAIVLHEIYQRLYYLPIIVAAFLFGVRGGLAASIFASIVYLPHIFLQWHGEHYSYAINQYAEIILFNVVGGVMGLLGDSSRRSRLRAEQTAEELQKAYAELRHTFEQLLQADRLTSLGELSAAVVHEVRNPLSSIKGAVEILESGIEENNPRKEFAEIAKKEIERLNLLVEDFLRFARPAKPQTTTADANEIIKAVAMLIQQRADTQSISVEMKFEENLPNIKVDVEQIKQVLLNLAINAIQAMTKGGTLIFITHKTLDNKLCIEVEDSGSGVDSSITQRIFDPFFTTKEKGVGLGLSIAYKIARQHGGSLTVKNKNNGAIFILTIPIETKTLENNFVKEEKNPKSKITT